MSNLNVLDPSLLLSESKFSISKVSETSLINNAEFSTDNVTSSSFSPTLVTSTINVTVSPQYAVEGSNLEDYSILISCFSNLISNDTLSWIHSSSSLSSSKALI